MKDILELLAGSTVVEPEEAPAAGALWVFARWLASARTPKAEISLVPGPPAPGRLAKPRLLGKQDAPVLQR